MLEQVKALREEILGVLAKADAIIAELEFQEAGCEVVELSPEVTTALEVEKTVEEEIVEAFTGICTKLIDMVDGEEEYNQAVVDSIESTHKHFSNKHHSDLCGTGNRLNKLLCDWYERAVNLATVANIQREGEATELTIAYGNVMKYAVLVETVEKFSDEYYMYLDALDGYDELYHDLLEESNAFSAWVDGSVKLGILL